MTRKTSSKEDLFLAAWHKYHPWGDFMSTLPEREYVFTLEGDENYRFDFAWPTLKVAVEVQGLGYGHQRIAGLKRDADKARLAIEYGWTLLIFTSACLGSEADRELAIWQTCNQIFEKGNPQHGTLHAETCRTAEDTQRTPGNEPAGCEASGSACSGCACRTGI